jgi:hypothetical protein
LACMIKNLVGSFIRKSILLFCLVVVFTACNFTNEGPSTPLSVGYDFVKSFATSDSVLFFSSIDSDSVLSDFNKKRDKKEKEMKDYHLMAVLSLRYGIGKMPDDKREELKADVFALSYFEMRILERKPGIIKARLGWAYIHHDVVDKVIVNLYEKKTGVWKIYKIESLPFQKGELTQRDSIVVL